MKQSVPNKQPQSAEQAILKEEKDPENVQQVEEARISKPFEEQSLSQTNLQVDEEKQWWTNQMILLIGELIDNAVDQGEQSLAKVHSPCRKRVGAKFPKEFEHFD